MTTKPEVTEGSAMPTSLTSPQGMSGDDRAREVLLPCPFCGTTASDDPNATQVQVYWVGLARSASVMCEKCGVEFGDFATREEATAAWNTRATTEASLSDGDGLRWLLKRVRACRLPPHKGEGPHGPYQISASWNVSGLTKLLPEIDAALAQPKGEG